MNLSRVLAAVASPVLAAGFAVAVSSAASAAPATDPSPVTACQGIAGSFAEVSGDWSCTYPGSYGANASVLTDWCASDYDSTLAGDGTITFTCYF